MPDEATERKEEVARTTMLAARDGLGELVEKAIGGEPQVITRYGRDVVVVLSAKRYDELCALEKSAA